MAFQNPTIAEFQAYFNRDFPYGNADLTTVNDTDIQKALIQTQNTLNIRLFPNQNIFTQGSLLLSAHFLVENLRTSAQGIAGKFPWLDASKSAGGVSNTFQIPDRILENPELAILADTRYGTQFLYLVLPLLSGVMFSVQGGTIGPVNGIFSGPFGAIGPWGSSTRIC